MNYRPTFRDDGGWWTAGGRCCHTTTTTTAPRWSGDAVTSLFSDRRVEKRLLRRRARHRNKGDPTTDTLSSLFWNRHPSSGAVTAALYVQPDAAVNGAQMSAAAPPLPPGTCWSRLPFTSPATSSAGEAGSIFNITIDLFLFLRTRRKALEIRANLGPYSACTAQLPCWMDGWMNEWRPYGLWRNLPCTRRLWQQYDHCVSGFSCRRKREKRPKHIH